LHKAIVLGVVNFFVKPVMVILTFPLTYTDAGLIPPGGQCAHVVVGVCARPRNLLAGFRLRYPRESTFLIIEFNCICLGKAMRAVDLARCLGVSCLFEQPFGDKAGWRHARGDRQIPLFLTVDLRSAPSDCPMVTLLFSMMSAK